MPNKVRIVLTRLTAPDVVGVHQTDKILAGAKAYKFLEDVAGPHPLFTSVPPQWPKWRKALHLFQLAPSEFRQQFSLHIARVPRGARKYYYRTLLRQSQGPLQQWVAVTNDMLNNLRVQWR